MTTDVIYADDTPDGQVGTSSSTYSLARSGTGATASNASGSIGQAYGVKTGYACYETFIQFNTSPIGTDTISAAVLSIYGASSATPNTCAAIETQVDTTPIASALHPDSDNSATRESARARVTIPEGSPRPPRGPARVLPASPREWRR